MWLDALIVLGFVAVSVAAGVRNRRRASRGLGEYFLAGRSLKGWQAGTSMAATQFAADTPLVVTGLVATAGVFALWRFWVYGIAFLAMAFVFGALWRRSGVLTDAELTEIRYSGRAVLPLRALKGVYYGTVINCAVLALVLKAAVSISEVFLRWDLWLPGGLHGLVVDATAWSGVVMWTGQTDLGAEVATANNFLSMVVILGFVALYSMTGGLRSVVFTDVTQFSLAIVGTVGYAWFASREAGGFFALTERLGEVYGEEGASGYLSFAPPMGEAAGALLMVWGLQWLFQVNADGTGYLAQRSMACETDRGARVAGVVFAYLQVFVRTLPWLVIALALLVIHPMEAGASAAGRELLFVSTAGDVLPSGFLGLLLVGMLAALASTLDTHMNWGAGYWSNDLYDRVLCRAWLGREPGRRELVLVARLSSGALVLLALCVVPLLDSIQQAWKLTLLFGAGVGGVLVLRWVWERVNVWCEVVSIGVSLVLAPLLLWWTGWSSEGEWVRLSLMALVSTAAVVAAALVGPRTDGAVLGAFYERVRPSGFWGRTAREAGFGDRPLVRFGWQVLWVCSCVGTLFLWLWGVSRLLLPLAGVGWWWPALALVAGGALVPVWWGGLRRGL